MSDLPAVRQEQSHANAPANFEDLAVIRQRTGRQNGADALWLSEGLAGQRLFLSAFKKMHSDIRIAFAFGQPDHRRLDRLDIMFGLRHNGVLTPEEITRLEDVDVAFESDLDFRVNQRFVGRVSSGAGG